MTYRQQGQHGGGRFDVGLMEGDQGWDCDGWLGTPTRGSLEGRKLDKHGRACKDLTKRKMFFFSSLQLRAEAESSIFLGSSLVSCF